MAYRIELTRSAVKELAALPTRDRRRVARAIDNLSGAPRPPGCTKLQGTEAYRIRVGDYRVVYRIKDRILTVMVIRVRHRKDVYRGI